MHGQGLSVAIRSRALTTSVDYDYLLDKVIARDVVLVCMKHYGLLDNPIASSQSQSSNDRVVTTISSLDRGQENSGASPGGIQPKEEMVPHLNKLLDQGYRLIRCTEPRITQILVDDTETVVAAIVPAPEELLSAGLNAAFLAAMSQAQDKFDFAASNIVNRFEGAGGDFQTISTGVALGVLLKEPRNVVHTRQNERVLSTLCSSPAVHSIARWQGRCYETCMPKMATLSKDAMAKMIHSRPSLSQPFPGSPFDSMTCEFSPSGVFTLGDPTSIADGVHVFTPAGTYDSRLGGHLTLKDWKIVVEIPPCATALFPSSLSHGTVPVASHERQVIFTQHTTGEILRWSEANNVSADPSTYTPLNGPELSGRSYK